MIKFHPWSHVSDTSVSVHFPWNVFQYLWTSCTLCATRPPPAVTWRPLQWLLIFSGSSTRCCLTMLFMKHQPTFPDKSEPLDALGWWLRVRGLASRPSNNQVSGYYIISEKKYWRNKITRIQLAFDFVNGTGDQETASRLDELAVQVLNLLQKTLDFFEIFRQKKTEPSWRNWRMQLDWGAMMGRWGFIKDSWDKCFL